MLPDCVYGTSRRQPAFHHASNTDARSHVTLLAGSNEVKMLFAVWGFGSFECGTTEKLFGLRFPAANLPALLLRKWPLNSRAFSKLWDLSSLLWIWKAFVRDQ